jgi:glycosyltransferase involved in cell wall biosynthesis
VRISIAMATYNGAKYLQEQLESFLSQTRQPDELIVCDDGSSDATLDILERFRQSAPFAVQIHGNETRLGFTKNFEKTLIKCSGDLVFLSDQDDVWFPSKVEVVEKAFLSHPEKLLVVHDGKLVDEKLDWHGATKLGQVMSGFGTGDALVMGALTAIRGDFLSCALPVPDGIVGHDMWLHNIARHLDARLVLDQPLQLIRRHSSNTSNWIASSTRKIGRFNVLLSQVKTPPANGYEDRLRINESSLERLRQISAEDRMFSQNAINSSVEYLVSERCALKYRNSIRHVDFIKRKAMSLQLLLSGGYRFFNGYKSFLRDFTK